MCACARVCVCVCVSVRLRNGPKGLDYFRLVLKFPAADVELRSNNKSSLISVCVCVCVSLFHGVVLHACIFFVCGPFCVYAYLQDCAKSVKNSEAVFCMCL